MAQAGTKYIDNDIREYMGRRLGILKDERVEHEPNWREVRDFIMPRSGQFDDINGTVTRIPDYDAILNSTATSAVSVFVAFIMAGMSSPARPWFKLTPATVGYDASPEETAWMDKFRDTMLDLFAQSNFYHALPRVYEEGAAFGNGCMYIAEDEEDVVRFYHYTVGEFYWGLSDRLEVDTIYRPFIMKVAAVVKRWGYENCSQKLKDQYDNKKLNADVNIVHCIEPNVDSLPEALRPADKNKRYISVYYEQSPKDKMNKVLSLSGFRNFPAMSFRLNPRSDDAYGIGIGNDCLADVRELQHKELELAKALDYMNEPHLKSGGGIGQMFRHPGAVTQVSPHNKDSLEPVYQVSFPTGDMRVEIDALEKRIREWFYNHLAANVINEDRSNVTAREIDAAEQEKLLLAAPVLESVQVFLAKIIDRVFEIMMMGGVGEMPPETMMGKRLNVEFLGVLAQAQRAVGVRAIERTWAFAGMLSELLQSLEPFDNLNADESIADFTRMVGLPSDQMVSPEDRQRKREARIQQEQQAQGLDRVSQMTDTGKVLDDMSMQGKETLQGALDTTGLSNPNIPGLGGQA